MNCKVQRIPIKRLVMGAHLFIRTPHLHCSSSAAFAQGLLLDEANGIRQGLTHLVVQIQIGHLLGANHDAECHDGNPTDFCQWGDLGGFFNGKMVVSIGIWDSIQLENGGFNRNFLVQSNRKWWFQPCFNHPKSSHKLDLNQTEGPAVSISSSVSFGVIKVGGAGALATATATHGTAPAGSRAPRGPATSFFFLALYSNAMDVLLSSGKVGQRFELCAAPGG